MASNQKYFAESSQWQSFIGLQGDVHWVYHTVESIRFGYRPLRAALLHFDALVDAPSTWTHDTDKGLPC